MTCGLEGRCSSTELLVLKAPFCPTLRNNKVETPMRKVKGELLYNESPQNLNYLDFGALPRPPPLGRPVEDG